MTETASTALAILPDKATSKIKPKPRKAEIVAALLVLKRQQWREQYLKLEEQLQSCGKAVDRALKDHVQDSVASLVPKINRGYRYNSGGPISNLEVEFQLRFDHLPAGAQKLVREYLDLKEQQQRLGGWDEKRTKQAILAELETRIVPQDRVRLLLDTPATKKALQEIIASMDAPPRDPRNQNS